MGNYPGILFSVPFTPVKGIGERISHLADDLAPGTMSSILKQAKIKER
jgi:predicted N-acyltransferase